MNKYEELMQRVESGEAEQYFVEDMETTVQNLQAAGLDFSMAEMQDMAKAYEASLGNTELSLEDMEQVVGGAWKWPNPFKGIRPRDLFRRDEGNWFNKYLGNLEKITRGGF